MPETDYVNLDDDNAAGSRRRTVMQVLYGMHTVSPFTLWSLSIIALVSHYVLRSDETDPLYREHHNYMIRTVWWTLLWLALAGPLWFLLIFPGAVAYTVIGAWYLYRCLRGWLRFNDNRYPA